MKYLLLSSFVFIFSTFAEKRPNILFIHMEDMGCHISTYGDQTAHTPNLNKMAAEGITFNRAHVASATCASSRGALFSGLYPHQNGIIGFVKEHGFHYREGIPTFVKEFKKAGYKTGITYKTGIESENYKANPTPFDFHPGYTENYLTGEIGKKAQKGKKLPLASFSVDNFKYFLKELEPGQNFYFQAQTPDSHTTWNRPHFIRDGEPNWPYKKITKDQINKIPCWRDDLILSEGMKKTVADYYNALQRVDWFVGRILNLLDEYGHADNTLVIFSADHGPSHLIRGKMSPYEGGLRVPFIVKWPGKIKNINTKSDALVSFVDLYPTFVDAIGLDIPKHLPGHSLLPVLKGNISPRKYLYSAYNAHTTGRDLFWPTRTITDGKYKLIHHVRGNGVTNRYEGSDNTNRRAFPMLNDIINKLPEEHPAREVSERSSFPLKYELYDLQNDPDEYNNLIDKSQYAEIQKSLTTQLQNWRQNVIQDPFLSNEFLSTFSRRYEKNYVFWKANGKYKYKGTPLDFSEFIPAWDPQQYIGKKD